MKLRKVGNIASTAVLKVGTAFCSTLRKTALTALVRVEGVEPPRVAPPGPKAANPLYISTVFPTFSLNLPHGFVRVCREELEPIIPAFIPAFIPCLCLALLVGFYGNIATIAAGYKNGCPAQQAYWTAYCTPAMVCPVWQCMDEAAYLALPECGYGNRCR